MKTPRLIGLAAALFVASIGASPLTAAPKTTAPISGILIGLNCTTSLGAGAFEARSWSWGATNTADDFGGGGGTGKASISALSLTRASDACSPALLGGVVTGEHFTKFTLSQYDKDGVLRATLLLQDVTLTSWQVGGSNESAEALEQVQLSFRKLTFTDVASGNQFSWDIAANKSF